MCIEAKCFYYTCKEPISMYFAKVDYIKSRISNTAVKSFLFNFDILKHTYLVRSIPARPYLNLLYHLLALGIEIMLRKKFDSHFIANV